MAIALPGPGEVVCGHEIVRCVGEGGMGVVYESRDGLKNTLALKLLKPEKAADPEVVRDFVNEAEATGSVEHENVVTVHGWGEDEGRHYILMEFVPGPHLDQLLEGNVRLGWKVAVDILVPLARALGQAHRQGLVHRDVKPGNILYPDRSPRLTDFGIVKDISSLKGYLLKGKQVGTAAYASPEQVLGKRLDRDTDMYSLGATLYRTICGRPPFTGESRQVIMAKHVKVKPPPPSRLVPEIPKALCNAIQKMLSKKQSDRYPSMERLIRDLDMIQSGMIAIDQKSGRADLSAARSMKSSRRTAVELAKKPRVQPEAILVGLLLVAALTMFLMLILR